LIVQEYKIKLGRKASNLKLNETGKNTKSKWS